MMLKVLLACMAVLAVVNAKCPRYSVQIFTSTSGNANGLKGIVRRFQNGLGGIDNGNNLGPLPSGQRSINWDAPGDILPFDMPFNFFDKTVTRGIVFQAAKREFRVSNPAPAAPAKDDRFSTLIGKAQSREFQRFSEPRLFTPVESNRVTSSFKIPAKNNRANTAGFGAVFTDVDLARNTWMAFYDRGGCLIKKLYIPPRNRGLSFGGIIVRDTRRRKRNLPVIWRVVTNLGNVSVRRFGGGYNPRSGRDLVVLDDLFYGEPQ